MIEKKNGRRKIFLVDGKHQEGSTKTGYMGARTGGRCSGIGGRSLDWNREIFLNVKKGYLKREAKVTRI